MKFISLLALAFTFIAMTFAITAESESHGVQIIVLTEKNWDEYAPRGKEVDAIIGDIVLRNQYLTAVIARPVATRNANMTVRNVGGCLLDLADRGFESDQLSCFYPAGTEYAYRDWSVTIDGQTSENISDSLSLQGKQAEVSVVSQGGTGGFDVVTTYRLGENQQSLEMTTEYRNLSKKTVTVIPNDRIRADGGKEIMLKSPNGVDPHFWIDDEYWQQAYVFKSEDHRIQSNSDSRNSTLKYLDQQDRDMRSVAPGASFKLTRHVAVGRTKMDALSRFAPDTFQLTSFAVTDHWNKGISDAVLEVHHDGQRVGVTRTNQTGHATAAMPVGKSSIKVFHNGLDISATAHDIEIQTAPDPRSVALRLANFQPGMLKLSVKDEAGNPLPAKLQIAGTETSQTPDFGPETAEFAVKNLRYTPNGHVAQSLQPGQYTLHVSRGPEYSAEEISVTIEPGQVTSLPVTLYRLIDTTGWVSADFHSHSTPSGDNTGSQLGRVLNLVCEHIEFAPCTEHNRVDTYQPHFDALKINPWISSVSGMELTGSPLPLNHQNAFPIHHHPHRQDGGAPVTDGDVATQIRRLASWDNGSDKLIQQNHPDIGWLFYDKNGDGEHDQGHADGVAFIDVMEIHPVDRVLQTGTLTGMTAETAKSNRIFKWLQLLNQGFRIPGVVNTDAHYNYHGSGWLRNWIQSSTDDPAKIDHMEMVHASEQGRVVMSNGPFLEMWASNSENQKVTVGQDLAAKSKEVKLEINVQCPNWHRVDTVFVLLNGRSRKDLIFTSESHPELFAEQGTGSRRTQSFQKIIDLKLEADTHIIAVTGGTENTLGPVLGPQFENRPPAALTNPIFVDVDGDGFTPNKDTLGRPLPVKGD